MTDCFSIWTSVGSFCCWLNWLHHFLRSVLVPISWCNFGDASLNKLCSYNVCLDFSIVMCFYFRSQPCKRGLSLHILAPQISVCMRMRIWTQHSAPNQKQNLITPAGTQSSESPCWLFCLFVFSVKTTTTSLRCSCGYRPEKAKLWRLNVL